MQEFRKEVIENLCAAQCLILSSLSDVIMALDNKKFESDVCKISNQIERLILDIGLVDDMFGHLEGNAYLMDNVREYVTQGKTPEDTNLLTIVDEHVQALDDRLVQRRKLLEHKSKLLEQSLQAPLSE